MKNYHKKLLLKSIAFSLALIVFSSCSSNKQKLLSQEEKNTWLLLGDSISVDMQNTLLKNVSGAIQKGGTDFAVEFCNIRAMPLTDSIAKNFKVQIQRLSDKNRNPENTIQTQADSLAWEIIKTEKTHFIEQDKDGAVVYFKPISIAMPTCIKCHGNKTDIIESTQKIIAQKYPDDKATGYKMGDLRGMWKIKINKQQ